MYEKVSGPLNQGLDQLDSRFTFIRFWSEIESTNDSQTIHLSLIFLFDLIFDLINWIANQTD